MCLTCLDCQRPISRTSGRGASPKRCKECREKAISNQQKKYRQKTRLADVRECCECGQLTSTRGKKGPNRLRCKSCNDKKQRSRRAAKYEQDKQRFQHVCQQCRKSFRCPRVQQPYCSRKCMHLGQRKRSEVKCARKGCNNHFVAKTCELKRGRRYCSRECSYSTKRQCKNPACQRLFRPRHKSDKQPWRGKGLYCSKNCFCDHRYGTNRPRKASTDAVVRAASRSALATSLRKKCKLLGVPHDPECSRQPVCERDNWTCQMCGIKCDKQHLGKNRKPTPNAAEHDHMIALTTPGSPGNVFPNSQCLCRKCNNAKRTRSWGQKRFDFEESVKRWENGARGRRQRNSRSCGEIPANAV